MKRALAILVLSMMAFTAALPIPAQKPAPDKKPVHINLKTGKPFKTGARPTPRHRLIAAPRYRNTIATPAQFAWVPSKLSMWLNDQDGDCVTAEEAFKCACSGIFIADATVQTWASANGVLNGADLDQVIKLMQTAGFSQDGNIYGDGAGAVVDYSTESVLQNAISQGPVKIGIDSSALPKTAGNGSGWEATGGTPGQFTSEDHCVSLGAFGPAAWLYQQLNLPLPSTLQPTQNGYLLFTWDSLGFVDHAWIMSTCGEAWSRTPETIITGTGTPSPDPPLNPSPTPTPTPTPVPPTPPAPVSGAPVITSTLTATPSTSGAVSYQIVATNSPDFYGIAAAPSSWSCSSTGLVTGTVSGTAPVSVRIIAGNPSGVTEATLVVGPSSLPVTITIGSSVYSGTVTQTQKPALKKMPVKKQPKRKPVGIDAFPQRTQVFDIRPSRADRLYGE
jgi:hypothetical protein